MTITGSEYALETGETGLEVADEQRWLVGRGNDGRVIRVKRLRDVA